MMVRFSDIIRIRDKKTTASGVKKPSNRQDDDDRLWFSEFKILKMPKDDAPEEPRREGEPETGRPKIEACYGGLKEFTQDLRERVKEDRDLDISGLRADLRRVIDHDLIDEMYDYAMCGEDNVQEMYSHPLEVTFVSLRVAKGMGYGPEELMNLGLAAFLENVGMYKVPETVLTKKSGLEKEGTAHIKGHPEMSHRILSRLGEDYKWLADLALETHERRDGSGYPKGLTGDEISESASIIGLADTYVAMIKPRAYRNRLLRSDAIKQIIKEAKDLFSAKVLKVFLEHISLFPVNTLVRLNNQSVGRVISTDHKQPLRPVIELISDHEGQKLEDRQIMRLCDNPLLYIVESLNEEDLPA